MNSQYDICIYKYHEFIFREFYMKKQPILVYMAHKSSGHMHDNMVAVGMHWKVMHACSIAI